MFGTTARMGLASSMIPHSVLATAVLRTEEELESLLASASTNEEECVDDPDELPKSTKTSGPETYAVNVKKRTTAIQKKQSAAKDALTEQAAKMVKLSKERHREAEVGETVRIPIPDVDRARGDFHNVLGVVLSCTDSNYKIGTKFGKLNQLYTRNQFTTCNDQFVSSP